MKNELKLDMKKKAHTIKGLVNVLQSDADYIYIDANDFDLVGLGESVREVKDTIEKLVDNVAELEYALYLARK